MTRAPHSRPEFLAVAGIMLAFVTLLGLYRHSKWLDPIADGDYIIRYACISSFYSISIACAILFPPFSNIFLDLNADLFSHYRLMWGAVLFSPFPVWLSLSSRLAGIVAYLIAALTLLPIPFWSLANPQLLHSKSRHIFAAPAKSSDQELLLRELMPLLRSHSSATHGVPAVLADPQVNHSLQAFAEGRLSLVAPAYRLTRLDQKPNVTGLQSDDSIQVLRALRSLPLFGLPAWIVQRRLTRCSYSVYVDSKDYDPCVPQSILGHSVNQLRPQDLADLGYEVVIDEGDVILWSLPQNEGLDRPHGRTQ